jgi:quercetin 2,3-dioxygenase
MKAIRQIVRDVPQHWVGDGFPVRSLFSIDDGNDPFLLLDYAGPQTFPPTETRRGVGKHPHRGFETVTIVYQGELEHGDSSGSHGSIGPGDVQWMTAAAGVVHEEYHSEKFSKQGGTLEMVQLWVNLPAKDKTSPPRYQELLSSAIPTVTLPDHGGSARVIAGELSGTRGPAKTVTPINVWDVELHGMVELEIPDGHHSLLVVQSGKARVNDTLVKAVELVSFERSGSLVHCETETPSRLLVLSGEPIGEPIAARGPFVMNTTEQIREAIRDYQAGRIG